MVRGEKRTEQFVAYVAARRPQLRRTAYLICGDWHTADDLVQTALAKLYVAWPRIHTDGAEDAYVRRIIVHAHIDDRRRPWHRVLVGLDGFDQSAPEPVSLEDTDALSTALRGLPERQRTTVVLRYWCGLSVEETAADMGCLALAHFDPPGAYLPAESTVFTGGGTADGSNVGTKLEWTYDDQDGMGLVEVAVTTPDYVASDEKALEDFTLDHHCEIGSPQCVEQTVPGTDLRAWVAEADPAQNLVLGVIVERADGSLAAVSVSTLFGNNSTAPVTSVDISLEQAWGFVTDPDLRVEPAEAAEDWNGSEPKVAPAP